jgi:four helix bundle protein
MNYKKTQRFQDLDVWQESHKLAVEAYKITNRFPSQERFGLISQIRRSVISVPANIAEGYKRCSLKEKVNFYNIAQSSLEEVRYYFILSKDIGFLEDNKNILDLIDKVGRMLYGLISSIKK